MTPITLSKSFNGLKEREEALTWLARWVTYGTIPGREGWAYDGAELNGTNYKWARDRSECVNGPIGESGLVEVLASKNIGRYDVEGGQVFMPRYERMLEEMYRFWTRENTLEVVAAICGQLTVYTNAEGQLAVARGFDSPTKTWIPATEDDWRRAKEKAIDSLNALAIHPASRPGQRGPFMAPTEPDLGSFSMRGGIIDAGKIAESSIATEKKTERPPVWPFKGGAKTAAAATDAAKRLDPSVGWVSEESAEVATAAWNALDVKISDSLAQRLMPSASATLTDDDIAVLADPTMGSW